MAEASYPSSRPLFLYGLSISREGRIKKKKINIYTLLFADDQVIIKQEYEDMEFMVRKLLEECEKWGLKINL